ncbi:unnamed protein product [Calicophoron daubneyi]|uniref:Uncharacterized protein n=1 Tax=Calicophoron daubneyi TaxID=300641 RepID=A0AAV2TRJ5_CALDB
MAVTFSRTDLICHRNIVLKDGLINLSLIRFGRSVERRFKTIVFGRRRKHSAGWQVALRKRSSAELTIPSILSFNAPSLFSKLPELSLMITERLHSNTSLVLCQKSWLNKEVDTSLVSLEGFSCHRRDRLEGIKETGEGVVAFVNSRWYQYNVNERGANEANEEENPRPEEE